MTSDTGKALFWVLGFILTLGVGFALGASSGLSWNGNAELRQGIIDGPDLRGAVVGRLTECMEAEDSGIHVPSYADACLAGTEADWEPDEEKDTWYE